jgi:PAS domain S-box-containing protein
MISAPGATEAASGPAPSLPIISLSSEGHAQDHTGPDGTPYEMAALVGLEVGQDSDDEALGRMLAIFEGALSGILLADNEGVYVDANPAICRMLGHTREELVGRSIHDFVSTEANVAELWQRFIDDRHQIGRVALRHKSGHLVLLEYRATSNILPGLHLSVMEDATTRVMAEEGLHAAQKKLIALSAQQQSQFEAFRAEMARDLHDELGQTLGALQLEVQRVEAVVPNLTGHIRALVDQSLSSLRDVTRSLRPPALDLGLLPALRALARDISRASDLDVALELPATLPRLSPDAELMAFRLAQEALNNAVRHSQASQVSLCVSQTNSAVSLEICDNGVGFLIDSVGHESGFGLLGMRERALLAGAELQIVSAPGEGTWVRAVFPMNNSGAECDSCGDL